MNAHERTYLEEFKQKKLNGGAEMPGDWRNNTGRGKLRPVNVSIYFWRKGSFIEPITRRIMSTGMEKQKIPWDGVVTGYAAIV